MKKIVVTGGAGQIAYQLLFRIAAGDLFGKNEPLALHILEVPEVAAQLEGVKMELHDCAFPLLKEIKIGSDPIEMFEGVTHAFLIGAKPRAPGMERSDLLSENGKIFIQQGSALNEVADPSVKVLVVGNPCNTNCLIALKNAPRLNPRHFFAMTFLDQNRAVSQLALKAGVPIESITDMTIWGNHSTTQVPDFVNAKIKGKPVLDVITDKKWLEGEFIAKVQKRGGEVLAARGKSSAASAANAALDAMRALAFETEEGKWYSMSLLGENNPYGIDPELVFSYPCRTKKDGSVEIVKGLKIDDFLKSRLALSEKELQEEKAYVGSIV